MELIETPKMLFLIYFCRYVQQYQSVGTTWDFARNIGMVTGNQYVIGIQ
jgi:hypothetical protein